MRSVEAKYQSIHQLMHEISRGLIVFPVFAGMPQARAETACDLLDSITIGLPLNEIIFWRTNLQIPATDFAIDHKLNGQRISLSNGDDLVSLFYALNGGTTIHYDFKFERFVPGAANGSNLPGTCLLNTMNLRRWEHSIKNPDLIKQGNLINHALWTYLIAERTLTSDSLDDAARFFRKGGGEPQALDTLKLSK